MLEMLNQPSDRAMVLYMVPDGTCVAVTDEPGSISFLEFLMIPEILEVVTWAEVKNTTKAQNAESISFLVIHSCFFSRHKETTSGNHPPECGH